MGRHLFPRPTATAWFLSRTASTKIRVKAFDVRVVEHHGEKINAVQKLQRTVTGLLPDGTTIIVSAFGEKSRLLNNLKLGGTHTFKGKYKEKTEMFRGKEKTSRFLNL